MSKYYPRDVQRLFGVSSETARIWAQEFGEFLSPLGNPPRSRHRIYDEADMSVFALVAQMKAANFTYNEVRASLMNGERGEIPQNINMLAATNGAVMALQNEIVRLQTELETLRGERDRRMQLEALLEDTRRQLRERSEELKAAYIEIGKLST